MHRSEPAPAANTPVRARDAGSVVPEFVLSIPVFMLVLVAVAAMLYVVNIRAQATAAARDAARAGALQRSYTAAVAAATDAAQASLGDTCDAGLTVSPVSAPASFTEGGLFTVQVDCALSMAGLNLVAGPTTVSVRSTAGLDLYRRSGD